MKKIVSIKFNDFEGGFWGFIDTKGNKFIPKVFPEQLKFDGGKTNITYKLIGGFNLNMWGETIDLLGFDTIYFEKKS